MRFGHPLVAVAALGVTAVFLSGIASLSLAGDDFSQANDQPLQGRLDAFAQRHVKFTAEEPLPGEGAERVGLRSYRDTETREVWDVDGRGVIRSYLNNQAIESTQTRGNAPMDDGALVDRARTYIRSRFPEMIGRPAKVSVTRETHGHDDKRGSSVTYAEVEFRQTVNDLPSPNFVRLTMSPTSGEVLALLHDDGPIDVASTEPNVSREDAVAKVADAASMPIHKVAVEDLVLWRDPETHVVYLAWCVELTTGDASFGAAAIAVVDAITGQILQLGES